MSEHETYGQVHHSVPLVPQLPSRVIAYRVGRTAMELYSLGAVVAPPPLVPHFARLRVVGGVQCWVWTLTVFPIMPDRAGES